MSASERSAFHARAYWATVCFCNSFSAWGDPGCNIARPSVVLDDPRVIMSNGCVFGVDGTGDIGCGRARPCIRAFAGRPNLRCQEPCGREPRIYDIVSICAAVTAHWIIENYAPGACAVVVHAWASARSSHMRPDFEPRSRCQSSFGANNNFIVIVDRYDCGRFAEMPSPPPQGAHVFHHHQFQL